MPEEFIIDLPVREIREDRFLETDDRAFTLLENEDEEKES